MLQGIIRIEQFPIFAIVSRQKHLPILFLLAFALLFVAWFYGHALLNANDILFGAGGDGIKNYYTMMYQAGYGKVWWEFAGLNYPYGHPMLYTDGHPPLANALMWLRNYFPGIDQYGIGILNVLLILSIFVSFLISYYLFLEFKISPWIAVVFSIGLVMWSPQIVRMTSHFSLAYIDAIPLAMLLFMIGMRTGRLVYFTLLFLLNLLYFFFHPYLGMISTFLLAIMVIIKFMNMESTLQRRIKNVAVLLLVVIPIPIFLLIAKSVDNHPGKIDYPSGFFSYNAELDDVFVPSFGPVRQFLDRNSGIFINQQWEAQSYIGFINVLTFIALIILCLTALFHAKSKANLLLVFEIKWLNLAMISAIALLLLAMAFPFKQFPVLLDYLAQIKQFRSTGRFAWAFYYVSWIFAAHIFQLFYNGMRNSNRLVLANGLLILVFLFNYYESYGRHANMSHNIVQHKNLFTPDNLSHDFKAFIEEYSTDDFQAILALPFYHWGSDAFVRVNERSQTSQIISYHTGLPVINANLPRLSAAESKKIVQLISPDYYPKEIKNDFSDERDLLVVRSPGSLTKYEDVLFRKCELIYSSESFLCYRLKLDDIFSHNTKVEVDEYYGIKDSLFSRQGFLLSDASSFLYYDDFEGDIGETSFSGKGARYFAGKEKQDIAVFEPFTLEEGKYLFSIWYYCGEIGEYNTDVSINFEAEDVHSGNRYVEAFRAERAETIYGNWILIEGGFTVGHPQYRIHITYNPSLFSKGEAFMDDLLIREQGVDVYKEEKNTLFKNNQHIPL